MGTLWTPIQWKFYCVKGIVFFPLMDLCPSPPKKLALNYFYCILNFWCLSFDFLKLLPLILEKIPNQQKPCSLTGTLFFSEDINCFLLQNQIEVTFLFHDHSLHYLWNIVYILLLNLYSPIQLVFALGSSLRFCQAWKKCLLWHSWHTVI